MRRARASHFWLATLFVGCVNGANVNPLTKDAGDGKAEKMAETVYTICDPDSTSACTYWTCKTIPLAFGKKTQCTGMRGGATAQGNESYGCPAGVDGGDRCPPSKGGSASHCVASGAQISCATGPVCDAEAFASGETCAPCTGATCGMAQCANATVCGGDGKPSHACPESEFWNDGRCVTCTSTSCDRAQCAGAQICQPCPSGQFNDGTGCRPCTDGDCFHAACAVLPSCSTRPGAQAECRCKPGSTRYCDGPNFCNFGIRTCRDDGTWGGCAEHDIDPPEACRHKTYDPNCCVRSGVCCEDWFGNSTGNCASTCQ